MRRTPKFVAGMTESQAFISQSEKYRAGKICTQIKVSLKSVETLGKKSNGMASVDNPRAQERECLMITPVLLKHQRQLWES